MAGDGLTNNTYKDVNVGQDLLNVPFPQMVESMGKGIAHAQFELDRMGLKLAQMMSGAKYKVDMPNPETGEVEAVEQEPMLVEFDGEKLSLLELGFTPTFYQFVDTIIEVKMSIAMSYSESASRSSSRTNMAAAGGMFMGFGGMAMTCSTVSASFASKFQYSAEGSSLLRTKLVPVPPPAILEERIRRIVDRESAKRSESSG